MTMLLVLAIFCLAGAAYLVGEIATAPARQRWLSVRRAATYGKMEVPSGSPTESFGVCFGTIIGRMGGVGLALLAALFLGGIGFFAPDYLLTLKARSRRERVRADLPDALDLLAVS